MKRLINRKAIVSGDIIEFYEYEKAILKGAASRGGRHNICVDKEKKEKNKADASYRARRMVRRLVNSNVGRYGRDVTSKFVTLTFREHVTDLKSANYEFKKFIQRLNYEIFNTKKSNIKYIVVPEFTKIGRIHYHVIFFNIPYINSNLVADLWGQGFIKINAIDNCDNVGAYVSKYMTKDNEKLEGQKSYFTSRGLFKPVELDNEREVQNLADSVPFEKLVYENSFSNEYTGIITYKQYNLKR